MPTFRVFRPTADPDAAPRSEGELSRRPESLDGKRIGLLWNSKVNADIYLHRLEELLTTRYDGLEIVHAAKPTASKPMEPDVLEDMRRCDLVVTAFGD